MDVFLKQPGDVLDYDVDMTEWFTGLSDDIQRVEVSIRSAMEEVPALIAGPVPHPAVQLIGNEPVRFKIWLGGGTHLVTYIVTCKVFTEQDRQKEVEFKIKVKDQ